MSRMSSLGEPRTPSRSSTRPGSRAGTASISSALPTRRARLRSADDNVGTGEGQQASGEPKQQSQTVPVETSLRGRVPPGITLPTAVGLQGALPALEPAPGADESPPLRAGRSPCPFPNPTASAWYRLARFLARVRAWRRLSSLNFGRHSAEQNSCGRPPERRGQKARPQPGRLQPHRPNVARCSTGLLETAGEGIGDVATWALRNPDARGCHQVSDGRLGHQTTIRLPQESPRKSLARPVSELGRTHGEFRSARARRGVKD
jgi:hypothetical protein